MIKWSPELVQSVHTYKNKNNVTVEKALADLKLPMGSFYNAGTLMGIK